MVSYHIIGMSLLVCQGVWQVPYPASFKQWWSLSFALTGHDWNFTTRHGNWDQTTASDWIRDDFKELSLLMLDSESVKTHLPLTFWSLFSPRRPHCHSSACSMNHHQVSRNGHLNWSWCWGIFLPSLYGGTWLSMEKVEEVHPQNRLSCIGLYLNLGKMLLALENWNIQAPNSKFPYILCVSMHMLPHTWGSQRTRCCHRLSSLIMCIIEMNLKSPGLAASTLTHWTVSLA